MSVTINIKDLGLTKQREVVLQVIREAEEHLTANEVFDKAKQSFAEALALRRSIIPALSERCRTYRGNQFGNGASRFDCEDFERHDHAICTKCGKLVDMEIELPAELLHFAAEFSKFKLESIEITLRGLCPDCNNNLIFVNKQGDNF